MQRLGCEGILGMHAQYTMVFAMWRSSLGLDTIQQLVIATRCWCCGVRGGPSPPSASAQAPTKAQWLALLTLTVGISLVTLSQLDGGSDDGPRIPGGADSGLAAFIGVVASVLISFTSGFASVYFEKTLKGSPLSMWARNLQMSAFSTIIGVAGLLAGGHWEQVRARRRDEGV